MSGKPREALWAGALGPGVDPFDEAGPAPWRDPEGEALAWRTILRQRWPREEGETGEAWLERVARLAEAVRIDPRRSVDPVYATTPIPPLEVERAGSLRPAAPVRTEPRPRRRGGSGGRRKARG